VSGHVPDDVGINFICVYDFSFLFWNCSDGVVFWSTKAISELEEVI